METVVQGPSAAQFESAKRQTPALRKLRDRECGPGGKLPNSSGRHTLAVHEDLFFNAILANGGYDSRGRTCWSDREWVNDQRRRHPEISLEPYCGQASGLRCRLGVVTSRTVYHGNGTKTEHFRSGHSVYHAADGSRLVTCPDGTTLTLKPGEPEPARRS